MPRAAFDVFFRGPAREHLIRAVREALAEDGTDVAANAVFDARDVLRAEIVAKEDTVLAGLPLVPIILAETAASEPGARETGTSASAALGGGSALPAPGEWETAAYAEDGDCLTAGAVTACVAGSARVVLRAERVILNFLCRLSGIAALTRKYVNALEGTGVRLLDTRKTAPGLRYPDKYAVQAGGGCNHRKNLYEMAMLKDTHIEAAGGITAAVQRLRAHLPPHVPVEVECRTSSEAMEAAVCGVSRIMLDNMSPEMVGSTLAMLPPHVEVELSGGIDLHNIRSFAFAGAKRRADFISVGRITHSAPAADFSMRICRP
ncbi:MAG: carboxylating nicotinate-nucleotide diphosphorylase [Desulfovibrio sp.]|jgi:nicotinate-nucleotide pyrophosphorylase (carboxylating)|nr:carboxylating nicotinate-nucleotide diphosphorylase [Desulfovibrio sp.]